MRTLLNLFFKKEIVIFPLENYGTRTNPRVTLFLQNIQKNCIFTINTMHRNTLISNNTIIIYIHL